MTERIADLNNDDLINTTLTELAVLLLFVFGVFLYFSQYSTQAPAESLAFASCLTEEGSDEDRAVFQAHVDNVGFVFRDNCLGDDDWARLANLGIATDLMKIQTPSNADARPISVITALTNVGNAVRKLNVGNNKCVMKFEYYSAIALTSNNPENNETIGKTLALIKLMELFAPAMNSDFVEHLSFLHGENYIGRGAHPYRDLAEGSSPFARYATLIEHNVWKKEVPGSSGDCPEQETVGRDLPRAALAGGG